MVLDTRGQIGDTITVRDAIAKKGSDRRSGSQSITLARSSSGRPETLLSMRPRSQTPPPL